MLWYMLDYIINYTKQPGLIQNAAVQIPALNWMHFTFSTKPEAAHKSKFKTCNKESISY